MPLSELSLLLFLQLFVILSACRLVGICARLLGQPQVIAEMIAGVLLGPSVLGWMWPEGQQSLFPDASKPVIFCISQLGLALYMFLVGVEFRIDIFRSIARSAAVVSLTGIVAPFLLGALLAAWLLHTPGYFGERVGISESMLYLGASMSITAFPVLARIIVERKLSETSLGTLVLAAGAIDDVIAWCLLAVVLAHFDANLPMAMTAIVGGLAYTVFTLTIARRGLRPLGTAVDQAGTLSALPLSIILILVMLGSWIADLVGVHAVFGAFIMGCAMPRGLCSKELTRQLEPLVTAILVPLFFAYSGMNTRLDQVNTSEQWCVAALVLLAACLGKGGACWAAARLTGADQPTALATGALMNARGLMELIMLNIGLQRGLITPQFFSIMVVMAIVTTIMASPVFEWVYGRQARSRGDLAALG